jgi:hypothetical protein
MLYSSVEEQVGTSTIKDGAGPDSESKKLAIEALEKADEGRTIITIAQDLTIRDSDKLREQSLALPRVRAERQILRRSGIGLFKLS